MKPGAIATEKNPAACSEKAPGNGRPGIGKGFTLTGRSPFLLFRQEMLQMSENRHRKGKIPPSPPLFPYKFLVFFSL